MIVAAVAGVIAALIGLVVGFLVGKKASTWCPGSGRSVPLAEERGLIEARHR